MGTKLWFAFEQIQTVFSLCTRLFTQATRVNILKSCHTLHGHPITWSIHLTLALSFLPGAVLHTPMLCRAAPDMPLPWSSHRHPGRSWLRPPRWLVAPLNEENNKCLAVTTTGPAHASLLLFTSCILPMLFLSQKFGLWNEIRFCEGKNLNHLAI